MTEIKVDSPQQLAEIVELARTASDNDNPVSLLAEALDSHLEEASEHNKRASAAQERTRERLGLSDVAEARDDVEADSEGTQTDVEAKQDELQERILD